MLHVALGVPVGAAEGVTTVEEFLGWVEAQAAVAGEAAVRAIGEPPVPMVRGRRRGGRGGGSAAAVT